MDNAFAWLRDCAEWLARFIPKWRVVATTHGWVKFGPKGKVLCGGPGIVWWWEVTTELHTYPVVRQTVPLPTQVVTTTDEQTVAVSGLLVYEITDLEKILAHTYDPEDTVKDIASSSLHDVLSRQSWPEIRTGQGRTLDTRLKNYARKDLDDYGVNVIKFTLTTCAKCTVARDIRSVFQEGEMRNAIVGA